MSDLVGLGEGTRGEMIEILTIGVAIVENNEMGR